MKSLFKEYLDEYLISKNQSVMEIPDININTLIYGQFVLSFEQYGASLDEIEVYFEFFIDELYDVIYQS